MAAEAGAKGEVQGAGMASSAIGLINNIVGAGLFSMPYCLLESTVVTGSVAFVLVCTLNIISFLHLAEACDLTDLFSYLDLGRAALGHSFGVAAQITTCCYTLGSLVSFLVLAADCLVGPDTGVIALWAGDRSFLGSGSMAARAVVLYSLTGTVLFPASLLRRIDALKYVSILAFGATVYAGFLCLYQLAESPENSLTDDEAQDTVAKLHRSVRWVGLPMGVWQSIPIINVAFTAHYNAPRFYFELSDHSVQRFARVVFLALGTALFFYFSVGVCGYLSFGKDTKGDILENFKASYPLAVGARMALLAIITGVFPKAHHSFRDGLIRLVYSGHESTDSIASSRLVTMTSATLVLCATVAVVCTQIEVVLAYKGAIFGSLMVYVLPPLMLVAIREKNSTSSGEGRAVRGSGGGLLDDGAVLDSEEYGQSREKLLAADDVYTLVGGKGKETKGLSGGGKPRAGEEQNPIMQDWRQKDGGLGSAGGDAVGGGLVGLAGLSTMDALQSTLACMFTKPEHRSCAMMLVWGLSSGLLGVVVTMLNQAGVL